MATCRVNRDPSPKGTLHVTLQVGGRAGVLLVPLYSSHRQAPIIPSFNLQMVAVIVGVNLEGLPFGMIVNLKELECKSLAKYKNLHQWLFRGSKSPLLQLDETGESHWFDKFVLEYPVDTLERNVEREIRGLVFSVKLERTRENFTFAYSVCISYRRKSES